MKQVFILVETDGYYDIAAHGAFTTLEFAEAAKAELVKADAAMLADILYNKRGLDNAEAEALKTAESHYRIDALEVVK